MNDASYFLNGVAHGDVASKLIENDFDVAALRPFLSKDGRRTLVTKNGKTVCVGNASTTLRYDDWKLIDDAVLKAARPRLKAVADLRAAGLTYTIPNGMAKTVLAFETVSDPGTAKVSMDGLREDDNDRPEFAITNLPLPIIHAGFSFSARQIAVSRNSNTPLDTTMAESCSRRVAEEAEKLLIGNSTNYDQYTYGGGTIYGYTDYTNRITRTITAPSASGWTGETFLTNVLAMRQDSMDAYHYGPWMLYVSPTWDQYLDRDFKSNSDKSIRQRVKEVNGIQDIRTLDYLTGNQVLLVEMTSEVVREVIGMDITTVQWESNGGMLVNFKVMAILVPQLRADSNSRTGIVHGNSA